MINTNTGTLKTGIVFMSFNNGSLSCVREAGFESSKQKLISFISGIIRSVHY